MTAITFDTLESVSKLKPAGIPQDQAEAAVRVIAGPQSRPTTKDGLELSLVLLKRA